MQASELPNSKNVICWVAESIAPLPLPGYRLDGHLLRANRGAD